jgi:hypothetical protein
MPCRTASASKKYRGPLLSKKTYSTAVDGRSVTLSGIEFLLTHGIMDRKYHPSACRAIATRDGIIRRFLAL